MSETVNLSFRYAESDYVRALRAHYSSRLRVRLDIVAAIVVAVLACFWLDARRPPPPREKLA